MFWSVPLKVKQYVVILSWQFDTHVKESRNFTVAEKFLSGTVLVKMTAFPEFGGNLTLFNLQPPT